MNVELLQRVKQLILEEPRRFNMGVFINKDAYVVDQGAPCGTVACIAGWVVIDHDRDQRIRGSVRVTEKYIEQNDLYWNADDRAQELLRLNEDQATRLFYVTQWPPSFRSRYQHSEDLSKKAKIAADRIDHFIKTNGAE